MSNILIYAATGQTYVARVRAPGYRKYTLLGKPCKLLAVAAKRMAEAMAQGCYKRGDVLLCADYYDPLIVLEMVKK